MKELLIKLAKLLPKDLQHKITMWFLKRKMKQIFPVAQAPSFSPERQTISEKDAMQMMKDPSFLKALEQLRKANENKPM